MRHYAGSAVMLLVTTAVIVGSYTVNLKVSAERAEVEHLRRTVSEPDFTQAHFFQTTAEHYCTEADTLESVYDLIVEENI